MMKAYYVLKDYDNLKKGNRIRIEQEEAKQLLSLRVILPLLNAQKAGLLDGNKELAENTKVFEEHKGVPYIPKAKRKEIEESKKKQVKKPKKIKKK